MIKTTQILDRQIGYLPAKELSVYKHYYIQICQKHLSLLSERNFEFAPHCRIDVRNKFAKLKIPFWIKYG